jgi:indole-3-glycerol phosphate synthase
MYLDRIVETKKREVAALYEQTGIRQLEAIIAELPPTLGFEQALRQRHRSQMGLIAEVKKASPSKGLIREDFHPVHIAEAYERAGADCLSVLTDTDYFQGSNAYLEQVRASVRLPILRKDFTIDELQIYEARAIGADAVLLIAAILTKTQMRDFLSVARNLGMAALVEVHDSEELERVLELDATLIGVNNRNLKTFEVDLQTTERLLGMIPSNIVKISESGISKAEEIGYLASVGADGVLVGEQFMRQPSIEEAVNVLLGPYPAGGEIRS